MTSSTYVVTRCDQCDRRQPEGEHWLEVEMRCPKLGDDDRFPGGETARIDLCSEACLRKKFETLQLGWRQHGAAIEGKLYERPAPSDGVAP